MQGEKVWSVPLPGTQASCVEEVGATARKSNGAKMWSPLSANLGVCTQWAAGRFFIDRTETEAWVRTVVRTSVFCFVFFLSDVEPFQGLEQRSGMN